MTSVDDLWNETNDGYTDNTNNDDYKAGTITYDSYDNKSENFDSPVYYIGTFYGNESKDDLEDLIQYFLGTDYSIEAYAKVDGTVGSSSSQDAVVELSFELYDTAGDNKSGKWKITDSGAYAPDEKINFYSVKGSTEFALYYVNPQQNAGTWTTAHVENNGDNQPGISHFSVVRTSGLETSETPEPATLLLFGFSLIWLAGMVRKKSRH
ncbi:MAG: PEP-CTERM sorting domain-containing protein [Thermodesulfobacteriota bacterium]|nr:PEP-CTERM sorting domain-containing protein [Thermodesulfobacteriota bacterium]